MATVAYSPAFVSAESLRLERRFEAAEAAYRALLDTPERGLAQNGLACTLLARGRLAEAWPLYEARETRQRVLRQNLSIPEWMGQPLAGKRLLVWREQGYGDQIMMARFLPLLDGHVTYAGPAPLQRLFEPLVDAFTPVGGQLSLGGFDYWVQSQSLPGRLGVGEANLPRAPYLRASPRPSGGRIGVAVTGEPANLNNVYRALPPDLAAELLALPGAISLQPEATGARDFQDTAEIIAGLDLVVTVDTSVAHLAGALGKPVWVLLAAAAWDWQWPRHAPDLWHPTARGFCQPAIGDWRHVLDAVRRELG